MDFNTYFKEYPNEEGYFGRYGGAFLPPELIPAFKEITEAYQTICHSAQFINELRRIRKEFQGRPTPVYHCERLSRMLGTTQIYLKREDLNHTGAHKLNHCMGEGLLAKYMGKKKIIAETGAGQHGVALATAAAYFGLECDIYMGEVDIAKQAPNVARMKILGARVIPATHGLKTLKEAVDAAFQAYLREYKDAIYCIGSVVGPHPFPMMVRDFQMVVGIEAREQFLEMTGILPDAVVACVGGGSNAMGIFSGFLKDPVELYGVEPLGRGPSVGDHAASMTYGEEGVMHGFNSIMLKDENGEPAPVHSIASGLDYPSSGPEHAFLKEKGRVNVITATDEEAVEAFFKLSRYEGIIPALESSHALAGAMKMAKEGKHRAILVNLSGRGDKDMDYVIENYGFGEKYI
ncbi:MAG: tryptophan synthase subunit beta [Clostridiales Family XIII bacterium]|nr:tryptophan synthase subunit beta [Clostridiales Family XIII bacterium]